MPIYAFAGSLTRPMPQYGAANGKGIARLTLDDDSGQLVARCITDGIDDTTWLLADAAGDRLYATCEVTGAEQSAVAAYAVDPAAGDLSQLNRNRRWAMRSAMPAFRATGVISWSPTTMAPTPAGWPDQSLSVFPLATDGSLQPACASVRTKAGAQCRAPDHSTRPLRRSLA